MKVTKHCAGIVLSLAGSFLFLSACCPSGPWQDNFGLTYQLITIPLPPEGDVFPIAGLADTGDLGCGVWTVEGTSMALEADRSVELLITNPRPNPDDLCCYSYHFSGHVDGSGCRFIPGRFETNDGKCTQSGEMYLLTLR